MRKLISTDLDGTIVFNATIRQADLEAAARWRRAGNLLVLNSGRSLGALRHLLSGLDLGFDHAVLYTGAVLVDDAFTVIESACLPDGLAADVLDLVKGRDGVSVFATTLDGDVLLYDTIGSGSELLALFTAGTLADIKGRSLIGVPLRFSDPELLARVHAAGRGPSPATATRTSSTSCPPACPRAAGSSTSSAT